MKKTYLLLAASLGLVKIGCSSNPVKRMIALRTMNAAATVPLLILSIPEGELHDLFQEDRHHGEWFRISQHMIDYLAAIGHEGASDSLKLASSNFQE